MFFSKNNFDYEIKSGNSYIFHKILREKKIPYTFLKNHEVITYIKRKNIKIWQIEYIKKEFTKQIHPENLLKLFITQDLVSRLIKYLESYPNLNTIIQNEYFLKLSLSINNNRCITPLLIRNFKIPIYYEKDDRKELSLLKIYSYYKIESHHTIDLKNNHSYHNLMIETLHKILANNQNYIFYKILKVIDSFDNFNSIQVIQIIESIEIDIDYKKDYLSIIFNRELNLEKECYLDYRGNYKLTGGMYILMYSTDWLKEHLLEYFELDISKNMIDFWGKINARNESSLSYQVKFLLLINNDNCEIIRSIKLFGNTIMKSLIN